MDMRLVINTGSTSKKYALYHDAAKIFAAHFEEQEQGFALTISHEGKSQLKQQISKKIYDAALEKVLFTAQSAGIIEGGHSIKDVGVRIVAPGTYFNTHREIDSEFIKQFRRIESYAPLHITPALTEIEAARKELPYARLWGISDSAFHRTIPEKIRRYSFKYEDVEAFDIWRFGYHGLSVASVVEKFQALDTAKDLSRLIVCHVGGGMSITAVREGESIDTSMGFSPVGGMHMSTRTGDVDPGAVIHLAERKEFSLSELREYLNKEGGFSGVTGGISDMRTLLDLYEAGNERAVLAIDMFEARIKKYIGAYIATLGGLDALILTATVSERNPLARSIICRNLEHLGILLDREKNEAFSEGEDGCLERDGADVRVCVIHTDEMGEIARTITDMVSH